MACSSIYRDCRAGVILGTGKSFILIFRLLFTCLIGTNACYFENLDDVPKWKGPHDDLIRQVVINTEWGALGKVCLVWIDCCSSIV
jgi:hypothetical protein